MLPGCHERVTNGVDLDFVEIRIEFWCEVSIWGVLLFILRVHLLVGTGDSPVANKGIVNGAFGSFINFQSGKIR